MENKVICKKCEKPFDIKERNKRFKEEGIPGIKRYSDGMCYDCVYIEKDLESYFKLISIYTKESEDPDDVVYLND